MVSTWQQKLQSAPGHTRHTSQEMRQAFTGAGKNNIQSTFQGMHHTVSTYLIMQWKHSEDISQ